ncbi:MAG: glycosyltransferase [Candidatus Poseidoniaceae archaeon]|jgi:glycosyltransferase involved in cell wall biosynthesis|nr:glycosyltransferase [Candidatus Poseidoniaceae archaeon]
MKVSWLSPRVFGQDLCSTTQINLANGLIDKGHELRLYSPGEITDVSFIHIPVNRGSIRGLQSRSVVKSLNVHLDEINSSDVVLVDWPLHAIREKITVPVIIMDRSPPADRGIIAKLQWYSWKAAWRNAERGTTVSQEHRKFVNEQTDMPSASISVIPAGVDIEKFKPGEKGGPLKLVYHGRVDVSRGVMSLPMILVGLQSEGIEATLHIHGSGNAVNRLKKIGLQGLEVTGKISQKKVANLLSQYDVGLLPMPEDKVWNLASPLKRSEYLSAGLVVCGIDHTGHRLPDFGDWMQLYDQKEFIRSTVNWLSTLDRQLLTAHQKEARIYAKEKLHWSHSVDTLESTILS